MASDDHRRLVRLLQSLARLAQQEQQGQLGQTDFPVLTDFVRNALEISFDAGFHFSDFCESLADFATRQAEAGSPWPHPEIITWRNTASILRSAAHEAETEGRELP